MGVALTEEEQARLDADLIAAIKASDTEAVTALLAQGANPNITVEFDPWGFGASTVTALILAICWFCRRESVSGDTSEEFNDPLVRALIEGGADLNTNSPDDQPLYLVVEFGMLCPTRYELVSYMLDRGADIDAVHICHTALYPACGSGDLEMIRLLLDRGANVDPQTEYGSPLMYAVAVKQKEAVALLLERGADVNYRACNGDTALLRAKGKRGVGAAIRRMLEEAGAKPDLLEEECRRLLKINEDADVFDASIQERWEELWRANLEGEDFNRARIHHVHLLCRLGSLVALQQDDCDRAINLLERAFTHPRIAELPSHELSELYDDLLYDLLVVGREEEAVALARQLMRGETAVRFVETWRASWTVRNALDDYLETLRVEALPDQPLPVSVELTTLIWDVVQDLRRRPLKKRRLPEQATPQELLKLLQRAR